MTTNPIALTAAARIVERLPMLEAALSVEQIADIIAKTMAERHEILNRAQAAQVADDTFGWPIDPATGARIAPR